MERAEKVVFLEKLTDRFERAPIAIMTDYRGLNVAQITELRRNVRKIDGEYLVAKNTLTRLAVKENAAALDELLKGPTGIAFGFSDAVRWRRRSTRSRRRTRSSSSRARCSKDRCSRATA